MNNTQIGVIDSGVGGLSIYAAIKTQAPAISLTYLADSAHIPYGTKSPQFITERSEKLVSHLINQGITIIVIACNTITVTCLDHLREKFPAITFIGTVPVIKTAAEISKTRNIGILSTIRTTESVYIDDLIATYAKNCVVTSLGTDALVPFVEIGETESERVHSLLESVLQPFMTASCDTLVLGCTHFPFLKKKMQEVLGKEVTVLDSGEAIARQLIRQVENETVIDASVTADRFLTTGDNSQFHKVMEKLLHNNFPEAAVEMVDIV